MGKRHLYFAFGSNLDTEQMRTRCPGSRPQAAAVLPGFRLGFAGTSSTWGGGVATVVADGTSSVPGLMVIAGESPVTPGLPATSR